MLFEAMRTAIIRTLTHDRALTRAYKKHGSFLDQDTHDLCGVVVS